MKRFALALAVCVSVVAGSAVFGQQGPTPEQQEMFQKLQESRQKMIQNMQDKGIDPREFFGEMMQQVQNGTLDPADVQKYMIDKGVMDQQMADDMQANMQKMQTMNLKTQLEATDDEWKILEPKIKKVLSAQAVVSLAEGAGGGFGGGFGGGGMGFAAAAAGSDSAKALRDLRVATNEKTPDTGKITEKLKAWRDAHAQAKQDLAAAQKELTELLTVRQEAALANAGVLQ